MFSKYDPVMGAPTKELYAMLGLMVIQQMYDMADEGAVEQSASDIFGHPDDWKLQSSMTLFELVAGPRSVFERVLDKYYQGKRDTRTLQIVGKP